MSRIGRLAWSLIGALALAVPGFAAEPLVARAYEVKFKSPADVAEIVAPILSADGQVSFQPRLKTITVVDRAGVHERIPGLLASFDLPPRTVDVTLALFLGTDRREQEAGRTAPVEGLSRDVRGVAETLADFTKWNTYRSLGGRSVASAEGSRVEVELEDGYRASWTVEAVSGAEGALRLRGFTLERRSRAADGSETVQVVWRADVALVAGRAVVVGAAQNPESRRALFVSLQAKPR